METCTTVVAMAGDPRDKILQRWVRSDWRSWGEVRGLGLRVKGLGLRFFSAKRRDLVALGTLRLALLRETAWLDRRHAFDSSTPRPCGIGAVSLVSEKDKPIPPQ